MKHFTVPSFWQQYNALPREIQELADKNYLLLKLDPRHASLHFKRIDKVWSVRVGSHYRALAYEELEGLYWFWIGPHSEYDQRI
jgi:hypothetical protein